MVYLLMACGAVYFVIGDHAEALLLIGFLSFMVLITLVQSVRSERALSRLRALSAPRVLLVRDGCLIRLPAIEMVRDDVALLNEGDRIPADGILISSDSLTVDESLLTGESAPVGKSKDESKGSAKLFAGSILIQGTGLMRVESTGARTELGKIGSALKQISSEKTHLQKEVESLVRRVFWGALVVSIGLTALYGRQHHDALEGLVFGLGLAMAILPNEIPAVLTVFFAMGAARIAKRGVITRNWSAIENLGEVSALCVDKTGTLTFNQMTIEKLWGLHGQWSRGQSLDSTLPESVHEIVEFGVLASAEQTHEPMEQAVHELAGKGLAGTEHLHREWSLIRDYPLRTTFFTSKAWKREADPLLVVGAKGAPEAVIRVCRMPDETREAVLAQSAKMASEGLRIIAVARTSVRDGELPSAQESFRFEFVGLIGLKDPLRPEAKNFISECRLAGIKIYILTGDHPGTAFSIAQELGLPSDLKRFTGAELELLTESELRDQLGDCGVFSRVTPLQKLRLVTALQSKGERVAMTGDGINDAPALKKADVGIAMGGRGTDVAREAAHLVLLNDDFGSILMAIRMGRQIRKNLKLAIRYLLTIHLPIVGLSLVPVFFRLPLILLPVQIALLHLLIEPVSSIAFEAATPSPLQLEALKPGTDSFMNRDEAIGVLKSGFLIFIGILAVCGFAWYQGKGEWDTRGLSVTTLMFANTGILLNQRSAFPRRKIWIAVSLSGLGFYFALIRFSAVLNLLKINPIHPLDFLVCGFFGLISTFKPNR